MRRSAIVIIVGLATAACTGTSGSDTVRGDDVVSSVGTTVPVGETETDTAATVPAGSEPTVTVPVATDPPAGGTPDDGPPTSDPPATVPPATDPPDDGPRSSDPPPTDPPPTAPSTGVPAAFDGVATFYAGSGLPGSPWAPLGWWDGSSWNQVNGDADALPDPEVASVSATGLDFDGGPDTVFDGLSFGERLEYCVGPETGPVIDLPAAPPDLDVSLGYDVVAVTADWPLQPRPVRQVGLGDEEYATVGAGLFPSVPGAAGTGEVAQVVRVDLDGDTVEEVLVTFEKVTPDFGADGDFSGVYARYPSPDGTVVDELVVGYVPEAPIDFPTIGRFTIAAVADLNGDSVMEVLVRDMFWESAGIGVYALENGRLVRVAGGGCGL